MKVTIYVQLLNEGTRCFRPVAATPIGSSMYRLDADASYDETIEKWEFPPGACVRAESRALHEGSEEHQQLVAVELAQ